MGQVIACPNCEKKLALRDEFKGRTLVCPQCKTRFLAPDEPADAYSVSSAEEPAGNGTGVDFLADLGPASGPASAARTATKNVAGRSTARPTGPAASRTATSRAAAKFDPKMIYIGGGIVAALVIVAVLVAVAMSGNSTRAEKKKKDENIKFGMTETKRRSFYESLIHEVDLNGISKATQKEWILLGKEYNLKNSQISDIVQEGLDNGWLQPAIESTMDQRQKTNRGEWVRIMTEKKREPIMARSRIGRAQSRRRIATMLPRTLPVRVRLFPFPARKPLQSLLLPLLADNNAYRRALFRGVRELSFSRIGFGPQ